MEKYKFENYIKDKGFSLSGITSLNQDDNEDLIRKIYSHFGFISKKENLYYHISNTFASKDFSEAFTFDILGILQTFNMNINGETFLIWNEKDIDKLETDLLIKNWDYIWYGIGDDALILYQEEKERLLLVTHYGAIFFGSVT